MKLMTWCVAALAVLGMAGAAGHWRAIIVLLVMGQAEAGKIVVEEIQRGQGGIEFPPVVIRVANLAARRVLQLAMKPFCVCQLAGNLRMARQAQFPQRGFKRLVAEAAGFLPISMMAFVLRSLPQRKAWETAFRAWRALDMRSASW